MNAELVAYLKYCWKSILTFLGTVATNAAVDLMHTGKPWPATGGDWIRWAVSIIAITWLVWRVPNGEKPSRASGA